MGCSYLSMSESKMKEAPVVPSLLCVDVGPICLFVYMTSGGRLNKKDGLTRYGNSHVKDKTS